MQYKYKRYSNAVYPHTKGPGCIFESEQHGEGLVLSCTPSKDSITKKKYWIQFKNPDGTNLVKDYSQAAEEAILTFPRHEVGQLPTDFPPAQFKGSFEDVLSPFKVSIERMIEKLDLKETHMHEVVHWERFWNAQPLEVSGVSLTSAFAIPPPQLLIVHVPKFLPTTHIDDGN